MLFSRQAAHSNTATTMDIMAATIAMVMAAVMTMSTVRPLRAVTSKNLPPNRGAPSQDPVSRLRNKAKTILPLLRMMRWRMYRCATGPPTAVYGFARRFALPPPNALQAGCRRHF